MTKFGTEQYIVEIKQKYMSRTKYKWEKCRHTNEIFVLPLPFK